VFEPPVSFQPSARIRS